MSISGEVSSWFRRVRERKKKKIPSSICHFYGLYMEYFIESPYGILRTSSWRIRNRTSYIPIKMLLIKSTTLAVFFFSFLLLFRKLSTIFLSDNDINGVILCHSSFRTVVRFSTRRTLPYGFIKLLALQAPINGGKLGAKLKQRCGFWLNIWFSSHVKKFRSRFRLTLYMDAFLALWLAVFFMV